MTGDVEKSKCDCKSKVESNEEYYLCIFCDKAVCVYCCEGDLEDEGMRKHNYNCREKVQNVPASSSSDQNVPASSSSSSAPASASTQVDDEDDHSELANPFETPKRSSTATDKAAKVSVGKRNEPLELKESRKSSANRILEPFPMIKKDQQLSKTASYKAILNAEKSVGNTLGSIYGRTLATKIENPNSKLKYSFEFKSKVEHENGKIEFHNLRFGDVDDKDETPFKNLILNPDIKINISKLEKEIRQKQKKIEIETSSDSDVEPEELITTKQKVVKNTPPSIAVTPAQRIRAGFDRKSGQSLAVQIPPKKSTNTKRKLLNEESSSKAKKQKLSKALVEVEQESDNEKEPSPARRKSYKKKEVKKPTKKPTKNIKEKHDIADDSQVESKRKSEDEDEDEDEPSPAKSEVESTEKEELKRKPLREEVPKGKPLKKTLGLSKTQKGKAPLKKGSTSQVKSSKK